MGATSTDEAKRKPVEMNVHKLLRRQDDVQDSMPEPWSRAQFRVACRTIQSDQAGAIRRIQVQDACPPETRSVLRVLRLAHQVADEFDLRASADIEGEIMTVIFSRRADDVPSPEASGSLVSQHQSRLAPGSVVDLIGILLCSVALGFLIYLSLRIGGF